MGDDDLLHACGAGSLHDREALFCTDVAGGQHSVVLLDEGENVLQLVHGFAVTGDDDALGGVFAVFAVVVLGGVGGQPDDLCAQLQRSFHRVGVQTAHRMVQAQPAECGELYVRVLFSCHAVDQIGTVRSGDVVGLEHNGTHTPLNGGFHQLEIVQFPRTDVRGCMDVHINDALHYVFHRFSASFRRNSLVHGALFLYLG